MDKHLGFLIPLAETGQKLQVMLCGIQHNFAYLQSIQVFCRSMALMFDTGEKYLAIPKLPNPFNIRRLASAATPASWACICWCGEPKWKQFG